MKTIIVSCVLILLFNTITVAESDLDQQVRDNRNRIQQLENDLSEMQDALQDLRNQLSSSPPTPPSGDPLIGKWNCTNNLYNYEIYFASNGRVVQQEAVLGSTRMNNWTRAGKDQIIFADGFRLRTEFESNNELSVVNINTNTTWKCLRIDD